MRRWSLWLILAMITAASLAGEIRHLSKERRISANAAAIHVALFHYQQELKLGISRKEVKIYLHERGIPFGERNSSVVVRVGEEEAPWFCRSWPDYVSFEFLTAVAQRSPSSH